MQRGIHVADPSYATRHSTKEGTAVDSGPCLFLHFVFLGECVPYIIITQTHTASHSGKQVAFAHRISPQFKEGIAAETTRVNKHFVVLGAAQGLTHARHALCH